ncbi:expansin EXLX1 family cellulose-binding protein [Hyalangium gracile]|uniref:expansin EXLX1 family cellulose-binding protein n=1 Tax=Hyalangium gracile TaxID=394092 RepID=UPI001CCFF7DC|nr:expansin EXLX1 family cellulose-binding protein [Hyalangium gracile]
MRFENVLSPHVLIAVGVLGLTACSDSNPPEEPVAPLSEEKTSTATRVVSDGTGNCNFDPSPEDLHVAALDATAYGDSGLCGACAELELPAEKKKVRVRIVDSCSGCTPDQLGLSPQVFDSMGGSNLITASVRWRYITCPVQGPLRYRFKEDSSPYWVAIQVRNHRHPIQKLEWEKDGTWIEVKREAYNYFVEPAGMGPGPLHLRLTSTTGRVIEDTLPVVIQGTVVDGKAQFED